MRYQQLVAASAMVAKRLSLILQDATNLDFQLSELNRLRDRVRRAEVQLDSFSGIRRHTRGPQTKPAPAAFLESRRGYRRRGTSFSRFP
jgi:hypothetical protein